jgi:hypothetical protein
MDILTGVVSEVKPSTHKEFGTVIRVKFETEVGAEHLEMFYDGQAVDTKIFFGDVLPVTRSNVRASNENFMAKLIDPGNDQTFAEVLVNIGNSVIKPPKEDTPNSAPVDLMLITKFSQENDLLKSLTIMLGQQMKIDLDWTQEQLFPKQEEIEEPEEAQPEAA